MPKTVLEELEELENHGDECPVSNKVFARVMRHLITNHLSHMQSSINRCRWNDWILFGALTFISSVMITLLVLFIERT